MGSIQFGGSISSVYVFLIVFTDFINSGEMRKNNVSVSCLFLEKKRALVKVEFCFTTMC